MLLLNKTKEKGEKTNEGENPPPPKTKKFNSTEVAQT